MKCLHYFCNLLSDWLQYFCQSGFESYRETFQRRKAGTKETIIKYRISSETFQKFAREVQSTLYQTRKDINYWHTVASICECLDLSSLTEDSVPNTKASKVFCTADLMPPKVTHGSYYVTQYHLLCFLVTSTGMVALQLKIVSWRKQHNSTSTFFSNQSNALPGDS